MESGFKNDIIVQIHQCKIFFANRFSDSIHDFFLSQTNLNLRNKKWGFLNRDLPVPTVVALIWLNLCGREAVRHKLKNG